MVIPLTTPDPPLICAYIYGLTLNNPRSTLTLRLYCCSCVPGQMIPGQGGMPGQYGMQPGYSNQSQTMMSQQQITPQQPMMSQGGNPSMMAAQQGSPANPMMGRSAQMPPPTAYRRSPSGGSQSQSFLLTVLYSLTCPDHPLLQMQQIFIFFNYPI